MVGVCTESDGDANQLTGYMSSMMNVMIAFNIHKHISDRSINSPMNKDFF